MTKIISEVTNIIDQDVSIRRALSRGFLNTRALAKYIQEQLQITAGIDAIISAIRRYQLKEETTGDIKERYKTLANAKITTRTRLISYRLKKNQDMRQAISKIYKQIDFSKGDIFRVLEVGQFIKIILDRTNQELAITYLDKTAIMGEEKNLGELNLLFDQQTTTPGVLAALTSELALNNIQIKDALLCNEEYVIVLSQDEVLRAMQALNNVMKWAAQN